MEKEKPLDVEVGELSQEVLQEWYAERESSSAEELGERGEELPPPSFGKEVVQKKSQEEDKKLTIKGELKQLLELGEKKGLSHAIRAAERKNDPFLLDVFHDILAKDENYKKFFKK